MLPLKLARSLLLKESLHNPLSYDASASASDDDGGSDPNSAASRTPMLVFLPTRELVADTYRLATIVKNFPGSSDLDGGNWNCCSVSPFSWLGRDRIETMDDFSRALAGNGWTLFKTRKDPIAAASSDPAVYLFRKVDSNRVRVRRDNGECRIRELRLPRLDFRNAPLKQVVKRAGNTLNESRSSSSGLSGSKRLRERLGGNANNVLSNGKRRRGESNGNPNGMGGIAKEKKQSRW